MDGKPKSYSKYPHVVRISPELFAELQRLAVEYKIDVFKGTKTERINRVLRIHFGLEDRP